MILCDFMWFLVISWPIVDLESWLSMQNISRDEEKKNISSDISYEHPPSLWKFIKDCKRQSFTQKI